MNHIHGCDARAQKCSSHIPGCDSRPFARAFITLSGSWVAVVAAEACARHGPAPRRGAAVRALTATVAASHSLRM